MKITWVIGLLLFFPTASSADSLMIEQEHENIAQMNREEYAIPYSGVPFVDIERLKEFIAKLDEETYEPPIDAYIADSGRIIPEQMGSKLHRKVLIDHFYAYFYEKGASRIELPMLSVPPRVDSNLLSEINVKPIGQYITYFNSRNKNRSHNISLAAEAINNHVVFPGETFSFNKVVGKRTKERGYTRAPVIVRGELSEDIGGGICQVSSTLFNAVDRAGVKIGERYSHSKRVQYVPQGRDATVSWYGPDFTFINYYDFPILIRAKAIGGQMIIRVLSSDEIDIEPRTVPKASKMLPQEITVHGQQGID
ncbi:VanW family protein [Cytobacillus purgationiresistens]|uniref:Vancomycin resistance protein YoaR n=1 Tax=Cytobacillus purgationiresistens TaxID=863449 RepID=A0ABU0AM80_9BACI|nr:VanW family protein [Cytobacillus purgationiresistens]MDQ0271503.1 vancomycin resistance protein YoaR [Cytobacillus purgationiresistens]